MSGGKTTRSILALVLLAVLSAGWAHGASDNPRVVDATKIMEEAKPGATLNYDGKIVDGDLDLSGRSLGTVHFKNATFNGKAHFKNTNFTGYVDFSGTHFPPDTKINGAEFWKGADFSSATFSGNALFTDANFSGGDAHFQEANFSGGNANFERANFSYAGFAGARFSGGSANFNDAVFQGVVRFNKAKFSGRDAYFEGAEFFGGNSYFEGAEFSGGEANFRGANFSGGKVSFGLANFSGGDAHFEGAKFPRSDVNFWGATLSGDADFRDADFGGNSGFEDALFGKDAHFNNAAFEGSVSFNETRFMEGAFFEDAVFAGRLSLTNTKYNTLDIRWHNIKGGLTFHDQAYLSLVKNFRDLAYLEDYDQCYFDYRVQKREEEWRQGGDGWKYIIDLFLQWSYGYGKRPHYAFIASVIIIPLFAIPFAFIWKKDLSLERKKEGSYDDKLDVFTAASELTLFLRGVAFSFNVFLSGTKLFIDPPDIEKEIKKEWSMWLGGAFTLERILGGLFSVLFILAISETVVR